MSKSVKRTTTRATDAPVENVASEQTAENGESSASVAPKKSVRRRSTKKAAESEPDAAATDAPKKSVRRRSTKKAAELEPVVAASDAKSVEKPVDVPVADAAACDAPKKTTRRKKNAEKPVDASAESVASSESPAAKPVRTATSKTKTTGKSAKSLKSASEKPAPSLFDALEPSEPSDAASESVSESPVETGGEPSVEPAAASAKKSPKRAKPAAKTTKSAKAASAKSDASTSEPIFDAPVEPPTKRKAAQKSTTRKRSAKKNEIAESTFPEPASVSELSSVEPVESPVPSADVDSSAEPSSASDGASVVEPRVESPSAPARPISLAEILPPIVLSDAEKARRERRGEEKRRAYSPSVVESFPGCGPLPVWSPGWLIVRGARQNNLKSIDVPFPTSAFTAVTGVSGSGKSSLVEDVLYRSLARTLNRAQFGKAACDEIAGVERLNKVVRVDQDPIGQTPTSNAATYTGVFESIRQLYAQLPEAKTRGYTPRRFSFNAPGGRCEKCEGAGQLKIEMHFLADVWITCDACGGKRYDAETLQVKYRGKSIADALETTCGDALELFENVPAIARVLRTLCDVGLDYLPLGQSATTLSGGEAQRVKLAAELSRVDSGRTLYLLDEPTTGLHFEDVRKLLDVLQRLVDLGNTVVVVEHNLDVIKCADWLVEIGPEAGLEGGRLVFAGTPEQAVEYAANWTANPALRRDFPRCHTGEALIPVFREGKFAERPVLDRDEYLTGLKKSATLESPELAEELGAEEALAPWDSDGRLWHTERRTNRVGGPCRWEGAALAAVVDKLEESPIFAETDWGNKTSVEIRAEKKSLGWFMRAITGEEWLLKLKFRTAAGTFGDDLIDRLNLRPLNEIDEIPLYGTQPRVKLETVGVWQEIELKVYSLAEIDRPDFWAFLDRAVKYFGELTDKAKSNEIDLTPWKTLGRVWHTTPGECYGGSSKPRWPMELLEQTFDLVESVAPNSVGVWTNKILVPFSEPGAKRPWCVVYTKNSEFVCVQLDVPKNFAPLGRIADLGFEPEVDGSKPDFDSVYLRFRSKSDFNPEKLRAFLTEAFSAK